MEPVLWPKRHKNFIAYDDTLHPVRIHSLRSNTLHLSRHLLLAEYKYPLVCIENLPNSTFRVFCKRPPPAASRWQTANPFLTGHLVVPR